MADFTYVFISSCFRYIIFFFSTLFICLCVIIIPTFTENFEDKVTETNRRFTTTSKLRLSPTAGEDYTEYSCQAKHKALQPDMPMRAMVQLSVLCEYKCILY